VVSTAATGWVNGIDWGVKETATATSDSYALPHAEHGKKAASRLTHWSIVRRVVLRSRIARSRTRVAIVGSGPDCSMPLVPSSGVLLWAQTPLSYRT
jgi:hypothetical protein